VIKPATSMEPPHSAPYGHTGRQAYSSDTHPVYDNRQHAQGKQPKQGSHGRRSKQYRRLWDHVKTVHAGDANGGKHLMYVAVDR